MVITKTTSTYLTNYMYDILYYNLHHKIHLVVRRRRRSREGSEAGGWRNEKKMYLCLTAFFQVRALSLLYSI